MARIRSLHPGQWTDFGFVSCSPFARLLALALRNEADDRGVFVWGPLQLKMRLLPADNVDIPALLEELLTHNLVCKFADESGKEYGAIRNFRRFQRPEKPKIVHPLPTELEQYVSQSPKDSASGEVESTTSRRLPPSRGDTNRRPVADNTPSRGGAPVADQSSTAPPSRHNQSATSRRPVDDQSSNSSPDGKRRRELEIENPSSQQPVNSARPNSPPSAFEKICEALGGCEAVRKWTNLREMTAFWLGDHDLETEILPTIREVLAKRGGKLPTSASYFTGAIRDTKNRLNTTTAGGGGPPSNGASLPLHEPGPASNFMRVWWEHKKWDRRPPPVGWGPAPGEPGCLIPPEMQQVPA